MQLICPYGACYIINKDKVLDYPLKKSLFGQNLFFFFKATMIKGYICNTHELIKCRKDEIPILTKKLNRPRKLLRGEIHEEKQLMTIVKNDAFQGETSEEYEWIKSLFSAQAVGYEKVRSLVMIFGKMMETYIPREIYRRKGTFTQGHFFSFFFRFFNSFSTL